VQYTITYNAATYSSIEIYQKIATINNHIALTALGGCYEIGRGVEKNIDKSFEYYASYHA
jgi:TPR repeat protein